MSHMKQESRFGEGARPDTVVATNCKARNDFQILDVFEAGLVLTGTEVKTLREGRASLVDRYASIGGVGACS